MVTRAQVLAKAASKIGTRDLDGAQFWRVVYAPWTGGAWCAAFVCWVDNELGIPASQWVAPGKLGCFYTPSIVAAAKQNGTWIPVSRRYEAKPGDRVLFDWAPGTGADHIGILEKHLNGPYIQTIEGNTSSGKSGSQSNGRGVWRRVRPMANVMGFVRHAGIDDAAAKPQTLTGLDAATLKRLQTVLNGHGADLVADGIIGPETVAAWQKQMGTPADGIVSGPESLFVQAIQGYLNRVRNGIVKSGKQVQPEWEDLAVDGVYGTRTAKAITTYLMKWNGGFTGATR